MSATGGVGDLGGVSALRGVRAPAHRNLARIYWLEAKSEVLKTLRLPAYAIPLLAFPLFFYVLFGVSLRPGPVGGFNVAEYLLATYGAFGVMNAALFGFGVGVASERGQGWLLLKRATPMPAMALFAGKLAMSVLFGALVIASLFLLGVTAGHVSLPWTTLARLAAVLIGGTMPFAALGLAVGYWLGPNSAPPVCNLLSLPIAFVSGLWIPYAMLPHFFQRLAHYLPAYHLAQLALKTLGKGNPEPALWSFLYLLAFTAIMLALACIGYLRDEGRTYG
jgi:ABC-2 type transport system permease protein